MGLLFNRVKQAVSGTPGTGAITLGAAAAGFRTFAAAGVVNGALVNYVLEDGIAWEYGEGTYSTTGPTLTRTTIFASSNGNAAISATSAAVVYCDAFAETFVPVASRNAQSSAYTVVANDRGKVIECSGTFTLSISAVAALGSGFYFHIRKRDGSGVVTIDPNGTEQIDGLAAIAVYQEAFTIFTDGAAWYTQGRPRGWISIGSASVSSAVASVTFTTGFGDGEITEQDFSLSNLTPSQSALFSARLRRGGADISTATYAGTYLSNTGNTVSVVAANNSSAAIFTQALTSPISGKVQISALGLSNGGGLNFVGGPSASTNFSVNLATAYETTSGIATGVSFLYSAGSIASGLVHQRGYRP